MSPSPRHLTPIAAALAALFALTGPAAAFNVFTLDGGRSIARWATLPVSYEVNATFVPYLEGDVQTIQAAFDAWSAPTCSAWRSTLSGTTTNQTTSVIEGTTDRVNRVVFTAAARWPVSLDSALAVTQSSYTGNNRGWQTSEADIAFNGGVTWSLNPRSREFDLQSVAAHEIGHLLGLQHSPLADATMYFSTPPGATGGRSLHPDDTNAVCFLYPTGGTRTCVDARTDCPVVDGRNDQGQAVTYGQMGCEGGVCTFGGEIGQGAGQGEPCQNFSDCADPLICVSTDQDAFCTAECNTLRAPACPTGNTCVGLPGAEDGGGACVPGGQAAGEYADPCGSGRDCVSQLCLSDDDGAFCSQLCDTDARDCPARSICVPLQGQPQGTGGCVPEGDSPPGTQCRFLADCPGGLCLQGADRVFRCRQACDFGPAARCATGTACLQTQAGDACFESGPGDLGAPCEGEDDCASLICREHPERGDRVCADLCEGDCPQGFECASSDGDRACFAADPVVPEPEPQPEPEPAAQPEPEPENPGDFVTEDDDDDDSGFVVGGFVPDSSAPDSSCSISAGKPTGHRGVVWLCLALGFCAVVLGRRRSR